MILPHPDSNFSLNLMVLGADIIKHLKKEKGYILVEKAIDHFTKQDIKRTPAMFLNALTFLYALGFIEKKGYRIRLDLSNKED